MLVIRPEMGARFVSLINGRNFMARLQTCMASVLCRRMRSAMPWFQLRHANHAISSSSQSSGAFLQRPRELSVTPSIWVMSDVPPLPMAICNRSCWHRLQGGA